MPAKNRWDLISSIPLHPSRSSFLQRNLLLLLLLLLALEKHCSANLLPKALSETYREIKSLASSEIEYSSENSRLS